MSYYYYYYYYIFLLPTACYIQINSHVFLFLFLFCLFVNSWLLYAAATATACLICLICLLAAVHSPFLFSLFSLNVACLPARVWFVCLSFLAYHVMSVEFECRARFNDTTEIPTIATSPNRDDSSPQYRNWPQYTTEEEAEEAEE